MSQTKTNKLFAFFRDKKIMTKFDSIVFSISITYSHVSSHRGRRLSVPVRTIVFRQGVKTRNRRKPLKNMTSKIAPNTIMIDRTVAVCRSIWLPALRYGISKIIGFFRAMSRFNFKNETRTIGTNTRTLFG